MSERGRHLLLHRLDSPARFLFFTKTEAAFLLVPIFAGVLLDMGSTGFILGGVLCYCVRKLQKLTGGGALSCLAYWYLPHNKTRLKSTPPSFVREWVS